MPQTVVLEQGCDIIIVGRGILRASNKAQEAEKYRRLAWMAYEEWVHGYMVQRNSILMASLVNST